MLADVGLLRVAVDVCELYEREGAGELQTERAHNTRTSNERRKATPIVSALHCTALHYSMISTRAHEPIAAALRRASGGSSDLDLPPEERPRAMAMEGGGGWG